MKNIIQIPSQLGRRGHGPCDRACPEPGIREPHFRGHCPGHWDGLWDRLHRRGDYPGEIQRWEKVEEQPRRKGEELFLVANGYVQSDQIVYAVKELLK